MTSALPVAIVVALATAIVTAAVTRLVANRRLRGLSVWLGDRLDVVLPPKNSDLESTIAVLDRRLRAIDTAAESGRSEILRLQGAMDSLEQAVLVIDGDGTVINRNRAAEPFLEARHADALVGAAVAEMVDAALQSGGATRTLELFGPPRRTVVVATAPMPTEGGQVVVAVVEDITELRYLESVRTDFVANVSHELRTPVGAMSLLAETLQDANDPEIVARLSGRIQAEAMRVSATIEDLLELSSLEGAVATGIADIVVADLVAEAVDRIRPAAELAECVLVVDSGSAGLTVEGNHRQLLSALTNLVDNAVKYSDPGQSIEVSASTGPGIVVLAVTDHGIGIPARDTDRVFERFYRVDQARSRTTGGTGLGLSIVRNVVTNHNGRVEIDSRLGEGSTFRLFLPQHGGSSAFLEGETQ
ncbi:MAG: ATP-binding protein [Acidimicrobiales bacterium]